MRLHCFNMFNKLGLFNEIEQEVKNEHKKFDEESEWSYTDAFDDKHKVSIFFDEMNRRYRIVDLNDKHIFPEFYETKDEAKIEIHHKTTKILGLILNNGMVTFK